MLLRGTIPPPSERPVVAVLATPRDAQALHDLFARRGFVVLLLSHADDLRAAAGRAQPLPSVVIVDLQHAQAGSIVESVARSVPPPVLVGVACQGQPHL